MRGARTRSSYAVWKKKRKTTSSVYELFLTCPEYFKRSSKWKKSPGWWRTGRYSRLVLSSSLTFVTLASFWTVPWSPFHNCWSRTNKIYPTSIAVGIKCVCSVVKWNLPGSSVHGILQARILESFPSLGALPDKGIKPVSPMLHTDSLPLIQLWSHKNQMLLLC